MWYLLFILLRIKSDVSHVAKKKTATFGLSYLGKVALSNHSHIISTRTAAYSPVLWAWNMPSILVPMTAW